MHLEERLWVELTFFANGALRVEINDFELSRFRVARDLQTDVILEVEKLARLPDLEKIVQIRENEILVQFRDSLNEELHEFIINST